MRWSNDNDLFPSMYDALQSNWGDAPSRTVDRNRYTLPGLPDCDCGHAANGLGHPSSCALRSAAEDLNPYELWESQNGLDRMGWWKLTDNEKAYVESCFAGKTLQQVLEGVTFDFVIDGVSRAFTHQNVRTRLGAGFMQHGGRDNDWRHRKWTMPETMRRMCVADASRPQNELISRSWMSSGVPWIAHTDDLQHCVRDWDPIDEYLNFLDDGPGGTIRDAIEEHIMNGRRLYSALVDAGIPWQDARRVLFIGMQTYIHDQYNYIALNGVLANRLEHIMDWEFNCVAQLMLREVKMKCPPLFSKYLGSHSDKAKMAKFAGLESWPPDGKWPTPRDQRDLPRQHRPEQMPFFVLHPDSMAGGPIVWIPTNGTYPHDAVK